MGLTELNNIGILYDTTQGGGSKARLNEVKDLFGDFISTSELATTDDDLPTAELLNKAQKELDTPWILWLRKGEKPDIDSLLNQPLANNRCYEAIISSEHDFYNSTHLEVRLFHIEQLLRFKGTIYPSLFPSIMKNGLEVKKQAFLIDAEPTQIKVDTENEMKASTALDYLAWAFIQIEEEAYNKAEQTFKEALKIGNMSQPNRVAALNGLANTYYQKENRDRCLATIDQSLSETEQQRTPYILLFRLHHNSKNWDEAYHSLYKYLQQLAEGSVINFDTAIPLTQTHFLLGESANRAGMHQRALVHYQEFYELKKKKAQPVSEEIIEKLLNYSIQLENRRAAEKYFNHLFKDLEKKPITEEKLSIFNRKLALFQDKEWYDFVCEKYRQVYENHKSNENIVRRLVAIYVKLGQVEEAQKLLSEHKRFIS